METKEKCEDPVGPSNTELDQPAKLIPNVALSLRDRIVLVALHGELSSQGHGVDWSDRPDELAATVVSYAESLIRRLVPLPDAPKG